MDRGQEAALEISLAKLTISGAAIQCGLDAISRRHGVREGDGRGILAQLGLPTGSARRAAARGPAHAAWC
ncbi:hypothetical protein [Myxococcus sp. AB036A]|uniref:hypothetical protein n=1 Tax=Myxococcus sp. AB036A TaxID=2562793 RepID=UPI0034CDCCD2